MWSKALEQDLQEITAQGAVADKLLIGQDARANQRLQPTPLSRLCIGAGLVFAVGIIIGWLLKNSRRG